MKYSIFCLCFYNYGGVYDTWMREGTWEMAIESHVCSTYMTYLSQKVNSYGALCQLYTINQ